MFDLVLWIDLIIFINRRVFVPILLLFAFEVQAETKTISCDDFSASEFDQLTHLRLCWAQTTPITSEGFLFTSEPDETVSEVTMSNNIQTCFLPTRVDSNFPNLVAYYARFCSIHTITNGNFQNLGKLKLLALENNNIKTISSDTFGDLFSLEILSLRKLNVIKRE